MRKGACELLADGTHYFTEGCGYSALVGSLRSSSSNHPQRTGRRIAAPGAAVRTARRGDSRRKSNPSGVGRLQRRMLRACLKPVNIGDDSLPHAVEPDETRRSQFLKPNKIRVFYRFSRRAEKYRNTLGACWAILV